MKNALIWIAAHFFCFLSMADVFAQKDTQKDNPAKLGQDSKEKIDSQRFQKDGNMLRIKTSLGDISIELFEKEAPVSSKNFLDYVTSGFYNGTIFHRVIDGFMIQGGGFTPEMNQKKTSQPIKNESHNGLENKKYTLAMARTSVPDSATAQFFINTSDNSFLDKARAQDGVGYAVFGKVVDGHDVVDLIGKCKTGTAGGMKDVPVKTVVIEEIEVVTGE